MLWLCPFFAKRLSGERNLAKIIPSIALILALLAGCSGSRNTRIANDGRIAPPSIGNAAVDEGDAASDPFDADDADPDDKTVEIRTYRFGLEQAMQWALGHNLSLATANDNVARSKFNVLAAAAEFEVKIIPNANAGIGGGSSGTSTSRGMGLDLRKTIPFGTTATLSGKTDESAETSSTSVGIQLEQPLLRGLGVEVNKNNLLSAQFGMLASERSFVLYQENLTVSVVRGFYEIIRQRELLALNGKSAERTRGHLEAARARERVGLASRIDVLRAEIQLRQSEDNLLSAQQAYGDAVDRFRIMLGFGPQADVDIDADLSFNEFSVDERQALFLAMSNRLDLAQASDEILEAERYLRLAKNSTLPELNLVVGFTRLGSGSDFAESSNLSDSAWTIGLATSSDVRRTAERARYEQSKFELDARGRSRQLLEDTVVREVKDALRRLEKNRKRIDIQKSETEHAQQKMRLAKMKFDRGLGDNFDLMAAEEEIIRAESNYLAAVTDYIVSQTEFKKAIGTLVERPAHLLR